LRSSGETELGDTTIELLFDLLQKHNDTIHHATLGATVDALSASGQAYSYANSERPIRREHATELSRVGTGVLSRLSITDIQFILIQTGESYEAYTLNGEILASVFWPSAPAEVRSSVLKAWLANGLSSSAWEYLDVLARNDLFPSGKRYHDCVPALIRALGESQIEIEGFREAVLSIAESPNRPDCVRSVCVWMLGLGKAPTGQLQIVAEDALESRNADMQYAGMAAMTVLQRRGVTPPLTELLDLAASPEMEQDLELRDVLVNVLGEAALEESNLRHIMATVQSDQPRQLLWVGVALYSRDIVEGRMMLQIVKHSGGPEAALATRALGEQ
jgi:hypothetical protein